MGKWFGVALLDNGKSGTPVNVEGKFVRWLSQQHLLLTGN